MRREEISLRSHTFIHCRNITVSNHLPKHRNCIVLEIEQAHPAGQMRTALTLFDLPGTVVDALVAALGDPECRDDRQEIERDVDSGDAA